MREKLSEKMNDVSSLVGQLEEYVKVVSSSSIELQKVSRLLATAIETAMKAAHVNARERLSKISLENVRLLEERRSACEKLKQEGQEVRRCSRLARCLYMYAHTHTHTWGVSRTILKSA